MPTESANEALGTRTEREVREVRALPADNYLDCPVVLVNAYRIVKTNQKTQAEYVRPAIDIYFDSGQTYTDDEGNERKHLISDSFINLSFAESAHLPKKLAKLGIVVESDNPKLDYDFVEERYKGIRFNDLPIYPGRGPKRDYQARLLFFKIDGQELLGRRATLDVAENKRGYNTIEGMIRSKMEPLTLEELKGD